MKLRPESVEEISVSLENRPGILADLCAHLSDRRINIRAMAVLDEPDTGTVRLVVDDPARAKATLADAGADFATRRCLALEMPDDPGGFGAVARALSVDGININAIYASAPSHGGTALGIFHVSDLDRAVALDWDQMP